MKDNQTLTIINKECKEIPVIDSREVAEMLGKEHKEILWYIDGNEKRNIIGIIPVLKQSADMHVDKYFIESEYNDRGRTKKCYLCTKMGCELLGNKQQGTKGILFSAKYVERFNQMEEELKKLYTPSYMIEDPIKRAEKWIEEEKERQQLREENNLLKPKGEYHDKVLNPTDEENGFTKLLTATEVAKDLGMNAKQLNNILHEKGIIYKQGKTWVLYSKYNHLISEKYCDYFINEFGNLLKWTEKGRKFIIELLNKKNK